MEFVTEIINTVSWKTKLLSTAFKGHKNTWNGHKREANWSQKELL